jgi:hypothetical protein
MVAVLWGLADLEPKRGLLAIRGLLPERPTPERCVEAYYLQCTRFERIAEGKLRRRQLTEDGNVEITGPDLRKTTVITDSLPNSCFDRA